VDRSWRRFGGFFDIDPPACDCGKRDKGQMEAVSNARQIGLALYEFETEYGRYPDGTTAAKILHKQVADSVWEALHLMITSAK
jgi:hypothetical protein